MDKDMKVYIWEDVLTDHTSGMAVIIAHSLDEAKEVFVKKYPDHQYVINDFFGKPHEVITDPDAFYVYGGG